MKTTKKITLDLYTKNVVSVSAKQYDTDTRFIEITCVDEGVIFNIDKSTMSAYLRFKKPDNNGVFNEVEITDEAKLRVTLTEQMLAAPGRAIADIFLLKKVYTSNEKPTNVEDIYNIKAPIISVMDFYVNITPTALNHSEIESSYEFSALENALAQIDYNNKKVTELDETLTVNENIRKSNEEIRKQNEETRKSNENNRISNENVREKNENARQSNETTRQTNESKRQVDTATAIKNTNDAATNANNKATDLQNKLDNHHFVLTEDKDIANGVPSLNEETKIPVSELYEATTTSKGITQLIDSVSSSSTSMAATPNSVKTTYDKLLAEEKRAEKSESDIRSSLNSEIQRATNAESTISTNLSNETIRATKAESTLTSNLNSEITRAKNAETAIQATIDSNKFNWNDKYTKNEIDNKFSALENNIDWKESVATFSDIAKTYPSPDDGWTVNVKDTDYTYRYSGSAWVAISANAIPNATQSVNGLLTATDKTAYDDANSKKHTHSNKSILDGITSALISTWNTVTNKLDKTGDASNTTNTITVASTRANLTTGEKLSISLGKIAKWFTDLKTVAFTGNYNDLSNKPTIPTVGNGTITIKQAGTNKGTFTMNQSGNTTIELTDNNTTYGVATQSANGLESAADKKKLDGIATGAEVNQNAFSNVVVGSTTISADSKTDTLTLVAGTNITLTPDTTNDKITISSSGGTSYTLPVATSSALGGIKSGTDITVDSSGNVSVNDDSHNHVISNVDGLQSALDGKAASSHTHNYAGSSSAGGAATNADKLDGYHGSSSQAVNTYVLRDDNGYTYHNYINSNTSNSENPTVSQIIVTNGTDNFYRKASLSHVKSALGSMTPSSHASTATTYGKSTSSNYGHVKLSDTYTSAVGTADSGIAASQTALYNAYNSLNSNLDDYKWTNWIHVGTVCGIELRYRYNEFQCSLSYGGIISNIITAYSQGYFWNNFPEALMPTMNILVPIVSNQDGLCLRCYPFESKKWYLTSMKSDITNTVKTYICGEYTYAHI